MAEKRRDSVIDPRLPRQEQERRVNEEIEKPSEELFGTKRDEARPKPPR